METVDFNTEGFLNGNYYQYIIKKSPEKNTSSLVEKRESAYLEAKNSAGEIARKKLIRYCYSFYLSKHPGSKTALSTFNSRKREEKLIPFIKKAYLYQEYYTHEAEAVLVFRIYKHGLKREIDSLALSPE